MEKLNTHSMEYLTTISMELASTCNLKCKMCSHPTNQRTDQMMNLEKFKIIIDKLLSTKIRNLFLNMGEPLMNRSIFPMVAYAKRKGFFVALSTNGILLTESYIDHIIKTGSILLNFPLKVTPRSLSFYPGEWKFRPAFS
jgi:MoaA/NifB/PqqE/SkfB family radical SAM enzyme